MSVELNKISTLEPSLGNSGKASKNGVSGFGPTFQETLSGIESSKVPNNEIQANVSTLKFSNHAIDRMRSRGVSFTPEQIDKLNGAVKKAAEKGGKDSLVLMNDTALIVSVKNNTVVTVVDKASLKENVFTNIDSTIVI